MIFGDVPVAEAAGAILAHSVGTGEGRVRKGTRLAAGDLARLAAAGIGAVTVVRLEDGDVVEDEAARRLAEALAGPNLVVGRAFTGRANLIARATGIVLVDAARVDALNRIDEGLTVATLRPFDMVEAGELAATVKVIPFAVAGATLDAAVGLAHGAPPLELRAFRAARFGLLHTRLPGGKAGLAAKARKVTARRLARLGSEIGPEETCAHEPGAVAAALARLVKDGADPILIFSDSAVADRRDVVPDAIVRAGGAIVHFGMPVDPGNLQLVARLSGVSVIAVPGSARSPRLHGFDFVLWRLLAGLDVGSAEITGMGVGGLLKEIVVRPQPRDGRRRPAGRCARVGAIVLAAGRSSRMGADNKLLLEVSGKAMVRRAVEAALGAGIAEVVVVTGHEADAVGAALAGLNVRLVHNRDFADGLSTSLSAGIAALADDLDGAVVMLGDMPWIDAAAVDRLVGAFADAGADAICVSTAAGKRGNPVLWARRYFSELCALSGDVGARHLIGEYSEAVVEVEQGEAAALDVDTPQAYHDLTARKDTAP